MSETHPPHRHSLFSRLRGWFLAGILVTAPMFLTIFFTFSFLDYIDTKVSQLIPPEYNPNTHLPFSVPGLGLILALSFFIVCGWFATNFLGRLVVRISEFFLNKMPLVRGLYAAIKQIFETVMTTQSKAFREVVMVEFPRPGAYALGFVTGVTKGEVQRLTENEVINVFVPTTPNPTSGFLLFFPKKSVFYLEMNVEEALKMIVSGGIIVPPDRGISEELLPKATDHPDRK